MCVFQTYSIRSIVCLNLPSFSGGLNPWGTPNIHKTRDVSSLLNDYLLLSFSWSDKLTTGISVRNRET